MSDTSTPDNLPETLRRDHCVRPIGSGPCCCCQDTHLPMCHAADEIEQLQAMLEAAERHIGKQGWGRSDWWHE